MVDDLNVRAIAVGEPDRLVVEGEGIVSSADPAEREILLASGVQGEGLDGFVSKGFEHGRVAEMDGLAAAAAFDQGVSEAADGLCVGLRINFEEVNATAQETAGLIEEVFFGSDDPGVVRLIEVAIGETTHAFDESVGPGL